MKAEELRVGNIVRYKWFRRSYFVDNNKVKTTIHREQVQILAIDGQNNRVMIKTNQTRKNQTWVSLSRVAPIEITEERLFELGFKYREEAQFMLCHNRLCLNTGNNNIWEFAGSVLGGLKHIHQIQNFVFAVSGIELEMKP